MPSAVRGLEFEYVGMVPCASGFNNTDVPDFILWATFVNQFSDNNTMQS